MVSWFTIALETDATRDDSERTDAKTKASEGEDVMLAKPIRASAITNLNAAGAAL